MSATSASLKPQRIVVVDALRGFALLGIIVIHFLDWYSSAKLPEFGWYANAKDPESILANFHNLDNWAAYWIGDVFFTRKFFAFFSFLFGLSFYLQMKGIEKSGANFARRFAWRLTLLLIIGLTHHAFWGGDILSIYAVVGFALIFLRKINDKALLIVAVIMLLDVPGRLLQISEHLFNFRVMLPDSEDAKMRYYDLVTKGSMWQLIQFHVSKLPAKYLYQIEGGRIFITLGFFLTGMYCGRKKFFVDLNANKKIFRAACKWFAWLVLITWIFDAAVYLVRQHDPSLTQNLVITFFANVSWDINSMSLTLFYISGLTLLMMRSSFQRLSYPISFIGKMALTSYLTQTVFGLIIYYGYGFGLFMKISMLTNLLIALCVYVLQAIYSYWWFKYFNYGIVEWLWRSATLLKWQPLKKKANHELSPAAVG